MNTKRTPPSMTHEELIAKMLENKNVRYEHERIENEGEFKLLDEILAARKSAVVRLENALISGKDTLSLGALKKYANAVGKKVEVHLV